MFLKIWADFELGLLLQMAGFKLLAKAVLDFWLRGRSHSEKMQINGRNRAVTFPREIQLLTTCDRVVGA